MSAALSTRALVRSTLPGLGKAPHRPRNPFHAQVYILPFDGRFEAFWATTEDIGHDGIFISSTHRLPLGGLALLKLYTERGLLQITARVMNHVAQAGFGCRFIDVNARQRNALSCLVAVSAAAPLQARAM